MQVQVTDITVKTGVYVASEVMSLMLTHSHFKNIMVGSPFLE